MPVVLITGPVRHGKSLHAVQMMEEAAADGRPIFTNMRIRPSHPAADRIFMIGGDGEPPLMTADGDGWWSWLKGVPAWIFIDEAHVWLPQHAWKLLATIIGPYLAQHAKIPHDIVLVSQYPGQLCKPVRDMINGVHLCLRQCPGSPGWAHSWIFGLIPEGRRRWYRMHFSDVKMKQMLDSTYIRGGDASKWFDHYDHKYACSAPAWAAVLAMQGNRR